MRKLSFTGIIILIILVLFGLSSLYVVDQTQEAIVLRMGKITQNNGKAIVESPGLHFKMPFIETAHKFDMRLRTLSIDSSRIVTKEQKDVLVDAFVKWRIDDISQYYKSTNGDAHNAEILLTQKVNDGMRAIFGSKTIEELVAGQRVDVMNSLQKKANQVAQSLGISVIDVRIKRIDLPEEVMTSVYARMRSDRQQAATLIRSQGHADAEKISAKADAVVVEIIAKAKKQAAEITAEGQALAANTYQQAYTKDPQFFKFYRSLLAYQDIFSHKHKLLILNPDSKFFNTFKNGA